MATEESSPPVFPTPNPASFVDPERMVSLGTALSEGGDSLNIFLPSRLNPIMLMGGIFKNKVLNKENYYQNYLPIFKPNIAENYTTACKLGELGVAFKALLHEIDPWTEKKYEGFNLFPIDKTYAHDVFERVYNVLDANNQLGAQHRRNLQKVAEVLDLSPLQDRAQSSWASSAHMARSSSSPSNTVG